MSHPKRSTDVLQIPRCLSLVLRHTGSANHFQVCDFGQIREDFILNALGKKCVLLVIAQIFKRKDRDAFLRDG